MTGGKIENAYSSGYAAIQANVAPTTINLSGTAALTSNGVAVMLGSHWDPPVVQEERIVLNMSGNATITSTAGRIGGGYAIAAKRNGEHRLNLIKFIKVGAHRNVGPSFWGRKR